MAQKEFKGGYVLILFLLASVLYFFKITMPLTDGDTAYYATIARNIIRTGNWQTLQYGETGYFELGGGPLRDEKGRDFVDKPPLSIWPIAVSYKFFGINDWSTKAWHALLAVACILLTYLLAEECYSSLASFWAGMVFLTMALMFYAGQVPQQDVPVLFSLLLAFWGFLRYRRTGGIVWFYLPWLGAAMAFMTRGPTGYCFRCRSHYAFWVGPSVAPQ
ncbi:MAG: ArnT family glycosyltransferase [Bacillota bacterium]